ncbi:MAG: transcription-repair coupling factor [Roseiflexus sp.]|nr:transcription-repair coupling factor [Roseiflexus sp.]MCS7288607.1 transcription-repair coupling factor [Roseiflexus sp.]MDW8146490.1 transcription-repair coupling factor [Roseiflexaceae bacterium]MDW8231230.1 transcription-repair coupling factor [Roseiflexaceae bacterium]
MATTTVLSLTTLLDEIAALAPIRELIATLLTHVGVRLHIAPAPGAARTPLVAAIAANAAVPVVYVMSTTDAALRAYDDLRQWLSDDRVLIFPASDALPYEHMSTGSDILAARMRVLRRLAALTAENSAAQPVIVAPVRALMQPTLTPAELHTGSIRLERGAPCVLDDLMERLIDLGYRYAPIVEEPGEVNRRGGIIDVFPPGDDMPLRIEFFGDEIDSLRRFDPLTQRSEAQISAAVIGPPHEFPLWRRHAALERMRNIDTSALRREALDEWLQAFEHIRRGERFEGRAFFAPFFRDETDAPATLLRHLPPGAIVAFNDALLLAQHAAELDHQAETRRRQQIDAGELPAAFPRPYLRWHELIAQADQLTLADFSNNERPVWEALSPISSIAFLTGNGAEPSIARLAPNADPPDERFCVHLLPEHLFLPADLFGGQIRRLVEDIIERMRTGERVVVVTPQAARLQELVAEGVQHTIEPTVDPALFTAIHGAIDAGFRLPSLRLTLYSDSEIFGWRQRRITTGHRRRRERSAEDRAAFLRGLKPGDYVVHIEHGIAVYEGMVRRSVGGVERDYLNLRYAEGDRLYVPVDQIDRVSRYIGVGDAEPQLTRLGTQDWERAKRKARAAVQDLADELITLYAQRQLAEGHAFSPDTEWQRELEASFPYVETPDQLKAIIDVKRDMEQPQPMDRLICGDVGFGKTEVALRAAFKAVQDGKQVAVLAPTTVLVQQHFDTFSRRLAAFPVRVEMISRFRSAKEQSEIVRRLARGEIDIIIGTHRLLSKDVTFKDLGLLVIDEEQRFGVRHKERIKQLRTNVDVITLTATPIPRTLHMALAGIRDLSVINTPPEDRIPIKTYVLPYDENLIREAILRELDRGGQVYFVHNRVQSIYYVADRLRELVPEARIAVGHGQLDERQLERVMLDFFTGKHDVLVCTTIIESGLDVPNANTIIIDDATSFGLAQLYQLRGRVGRSTQRAYAYLFYKSERPATPEAQERLRAIQEATELGAGFRIAMRDLEMRGAGNLLGAEQSGHIAAIGFDLYSRLLEQAVRTLKQRLAATNTITDSAASRTSSPAVAAEPTSPPSRPSPTSRPPSVKVDEKVLISPLVTLDLPLDAYLPVDYIPDDQVRLAVYQRMAEAQTPEAVHDLRQELRDRFGELPEPAEQLLIWLRIKALALAAGVTSVVTTDEEFIVRLPEGVDGRRARLERRFARTKGVRIGPQFVRIDRRVHNADGDPAWIEVLCDVLKVLGMKG